MAKRRQIKNQYIRFGRTAQGPYANNLGGGFHARSLARGVAPCFYIVSAQIGDPYPDIITVCYNAPFDPAACGNALDWNFYTQARGPFDNQSAAGEPSATCDWWLAQYTGESVSGATPVDLVFLDYSPGICHKVGDTDCALEAYSGYSVENRILGPIVQRIGDVADNIVVVGFGVPMSVATTNWAVDINALPATITNRTVVGNAIHLTLSASVSPGDTVTVTHNPSNSFEGAQAADGRFVYKFYDLPVNNNVGISFWIREDLGQWRTEDPGRWQLE